MKFDFYLNIMVNYWQKFCISIVAIFLLGQGVAHSEYYPEDVELIETQLVNGSEDYIVDINEQSSRLYYLVPPNELLGDVASYGVIPNITIEGKLILKDLTNIDRTRIKLGKSRLQASNGQVNTDIIINLRGEIGGKDLGTNYVKPEFNDVGETYFIIEGYIDPRSYSRELPPGDYDFWQDLSFNVNIQNNNGNGNGNNKNK